MNQIPVENAVGMVLAHDITRIVPGEFKGVGFKKGHIVCAEDIPKLLEIGKRHLYVLDLSDDQIHEDDAALKIAAAICGPGLRWTNPKEGKTNIIAKTDGLLKIDIQGLLDINSLDDIIVSTLKTHFPCSADQVVAATRIIPLVIAAQKLERLEKIATNHQPVIQIRPYRKLKVGAVVTGSEIYNGLIHDGFDEFVGSTIKSYGCEIVKKIVVSDDGAAIAKAILACRDAGSELIVTTGGLSVDPDDVTRAGVRQAGANTIVYGSPVLPGAMVLLARLGDIPILGLPACVFYHRTTIFTLLFPRFLAGEEITRSEIAAMGHGSLCLQCDTCHYPVCPFGK
jgi:hypothetical protein